jgi:hypothetical protein
MYSTMHNPPFSGSYAPEDVCFLLTPAHLKTLDLQTKEALIQSGEKHYSELLSEEPVPTARYLQLYQDALNRNGRRVAEGVLSLAAHLNSTLSGPIQLISLARAGTPVGVLLTRLLRSRFGRSVFHASVSILRDKGLDQEALLWLKNHSSSSPENWVFIDGWTGKGAIAQTLRRSIEKNQAILPLQPTLYVLADLCGEASVCGTTEDYLIPSSLLGATVSGLISRTVLNEQVKPGEFHACAFYSKLIHQDQSLHFIHAIEQQLSSLSQPPTLLKTNPAIQKAASEEALSAIMARYQVADRNRIKPGIGEATRVLLRRVPDRLLLRNLQDPDIQHALLLAKEGGVVIEEDPALPWRALSIIKGK